MHIKNRKGEAITLALVAVVAVMGTLFFGPKLNLFDASADPSNRRSESHFTGEEIATITKAAGEADREVVIERRVEASKEVTDPKLTLGQRVGRFFSGLGTWALLLIAAALALGIVTPAGLAWHARNSWKSAFRNTVDAVRDLDDETYQKVAPKLAAKQDKRDKILVDRIKSELH